jgi:DNA-directed RNA polymerase specialized sigma24 family protein
VPEPIFSEGGIQAALSQYGESIVAYAALCTATPAWGEQLVREALARTVRETGRSVEQTSTLRWLTAVRKTAAYWAAHGQGRRLDPDLRNWLASERAARYAGGRADQPSTLRALMDIPEPDRSLLWLVEVESLPLTKAVQRLGMGSSDMSEEMDRVRTVFRSRLLRNHVDVLADAECHGYAGLLGVVTRVPDASTPADLAQHLHRCSRCAEAEIALRAYHDALPRLLAREALGWGGLAYLERRRTSVEHSSGAGAELVTVRPGEPGTGEQNKAGGRWGRPGMTVTAVVVTAVLTALGVALLTSGPSGVVVPENAQGESERGAAPPVSESDIEAGGGTPPEPSTSSVSPTPPAAAREHTETGRTPSADPPTSAAEPGISEAARPSQAACRAEYKLATEWPEGFKGGFVITSHSALTDWQFRWTFPDGQRVTEVYGGSFVQNGAQVTVTAADYDKAVPAGGSFEVYFLGSWKDRNSPPGAFTLNNRDCSD